MTRLGIAYAAQPGQPGDRGLRHWNQIVCEMAKGSRRRGGDGILLCRILIGAVQDGIEAHIRAGLHIDQHGCIVYTAGSRWSLGRHVCAATMTSSEPIKFSDGTATSTRSNAS